MIKAVIVIVLLLSILQTGMGGITCLNGRCFESGSSDNVFSTGGGGQGGNGPVTCIDGKCFGGNPDWKNDLSLGSNFIRFA